LLLVLATGVGEADPSRAGEARQPAIARPAADALFDAARSHPLVALSEGQHWNEPFHRFRLALLRDPRFAAAFDDIVVESGSARYQEVMDRFIAGGNVPRDEIRQVWENSTQPTEVWDVPIYEEFFRAVRAANASLPADRKLRVILADPPIDWTTVKNTDDVLRWNDQRDAFAAEVTRREVLDKKRRALLVFGDGHLWRHGPKDRPDVASPRSVTSFVLESAPGALFAIGTPTAADLTRIQPDTARWPAPSIALLDGTVLGLAPFAPYYATPFQELRGEPFDHLRLQDQFDALLYLGPPATITQAPFPRALCADWRYMSMRKARLSLVPWGKYGVERLEKACATVTR
jgi:hypothetical protein